MNNVRMMRYHTRTRTMGSIEVYDAKQEKWVPYVPDYNAWYQHFKEMDTSTPTNGTLCRWQWEEIQKAKRNRIMRKGNGSA